MRRFFKYLFISAFGAFTSCSSDPEPINQNDAAYMPLKNGTYQIYTVDSTWYTPIEGEQTIHYELMMMVVDSFLNAQEGYTKVIYRYKRDDVSNPWRYHDTWSARISDTRAIVAEGNTEFVKFVMPVSDGKKWNGNLFNSLGEDEYEMINTRRPFTVDGTMFDDCIEVIQNEDDDPIVQTDIRKEVYARDVGLVLREVTILNFCTVGCTTFGEIETGVRYSQRIKEHGVE